MAGRVERRINDKFYFVLDEVGGSSDCETEMGSDVPAVSTDDLTETGNVTNLKDSRDTKHTTGSNDLGNRSPSHEENISQHSDDSGEIDDKRAKISSGCSVPNRSKSPHKSKSSSYPDEPAVVDMDIDSDVECAQAKAKPLLRITFRDEAVEKRLKSSFSKFITQKFEDIIIINSENSLELEVYDKEPRKLLEDDLLDFDLDTTPGDNHVDVPNYGKPQDLLLTSDKISEDKQANGKLHAPAPSCFNCLGNHVLRDCPQAKDFKVINKNRLKFQNQKEKLPKTSRYHQDENQKFSHLMPGAISKKLRNALNLRRDQQPGFIYKMRQLGYPPAWLEEAKVSHSGVTMYDDTGVPVLEEDEEEGEILPEGAKDKYDITKIIEFPGFNVPLPSNYKEESKYYQCPPYSDEHSKDNLIKLLEPKTVQAYVKKSLPSQKSERKSVPQTNAKGTSSPTIEEMEEKKRQLLMELNSEDPGSDSKTASEEASCSSSSRLTPPKESRGNKNVGTVTNLEFGTPILKSVSPFSKLPTREQFSCNVSDVINFENLPNSTGKYETMREVISKIRVSTSKSQKE